MNLLTRLRQTYLHWTGGIRFYIALAILVVSVGVLWWASASYGGSNLVTIRLEQTYAWLAVGLLGLTLATGPVYKVWPGLPVKRVMFDARRLLGIGAAWFACLHVYLAYFVQFQAPNPTTLPGNYKSSFLQGLVALIILALMAFTSFNAAQRTMAVWWYRLHRLVYPAVVLTLLHAFMIGTHAAEWVALIALTAGAVIIFGLHMYLLLTRRGRPIVWQLLTMGAMFVALLLVFTYGYGRHGL